MRTLVNMATFTIESVESDLLNYSDFEEVASVSRAKSFVTAANRWFILAPQSSSNQSSSLTFDTEAVKELRRRAQDYIGANESVNGASSSVNFLSVNHGFR